MTKPVQQLYDKMHKSYGKFLTDQGNLECALTEVIDFDFCIQYQGGDGFCILDYNESSVAPIEHAVEYLKEGKKYTQDEHRGFCI